MWNYNRELTVINQSLSFFILQINLHLPNTNATRAFFIRELVLLMKVREPYIDSTIHRNNRNGQWTGDRFDWCTGTYIRNSNDRFITDFLFLQLLCKLVERQRTYRARVSLSNQFSLGWCNVYCSRTPVLVN